MKQDETYYHKRGGQPKQGYVKCERCAGEGYLCVDEKKYGADEVQCPDCKGTGEIIKPLNQSVNGSIEPLKSEDRMKQIEEICEKHNFIVDSRIDFLGAALEEILPEGYWERETIGREETTWILLKLFVKTEEWARYRALKDIKELGEKDGVYARYEGIWHEMFDYKTTDIDEGENGRLPRKMPNSEYIKIHLKDLNKKLGTE